MSNVTWLRRTSDMRRVYGKARLILVPSQWEEAFGRVVAEAQVSGIPALASCIGGLPEAVGPGGLLVDPAAPTAQWVAALRRIWDDRSEQVRLSAAALRHAQRPKMNARHQTDLLEEAILNRLHTADSFEPTAPPRRHGKGT